MKRRPLSARMLQGRARSRLRFFRQSSQLAVALTGFLLLFSEGPDSLAQETAAPDQPAAELPLIPEGDATESVAQATATISDLLASFYALLPRLLIAFLILFAFWFLAHTIQKFYQWISGRSQRGASIVALTKIALFLVGLIAALSVTVGDARALLGSLGLVGLALSWALQAPIESFTGWILNAFRGYYYIGDRIEVGDVFGDVYKIDFLTTTVWEAGGPGKPVSAAQPTGALITFPNSEVLRSNIINYTKDFPYTWDEVSFGLANESDISYAVKVIRDKAREIIGDEMSQYIGRYRKLLVRQNLAYDVEDEPQVFLSLTDSWTNYTVRYLVETRARRKWSSRLIEEISKELGSEKHKGKIRSSFPRQEWVWIGSNPPQAPDQQAEP